MSEETNENLVNDLDGKLMRCTMIGCESTFRITKDKVGPRFNCQCNKDQDIAKILAQNRIKTFHTCGSEIVE